MSDVTQILAEVRDGDADATQRPWLYQACRESGA
jgi:hypothetical protein